MQAFQPCNCGLGSSNHSHFVGMGRARRSAARRLRMINKRESSPSRRRAPATRGGIYPINHQTHEQEPGARRPLWLAHRLLSRLQPVRASEWLNDAKRTGC
jgi:hypothetical protein